MSTCNFEISWVGRCKKPAIEGHDKCEEHKDLKCCSCGKPATHDCYETGQFVCGAPLCNDCEHATFPDGTNGGIGFNAQKLPEGLKYHCLKTEQKFKPWYNDERQD